MKTKFIFITGGVVSSLGKGIAAASIAAILKSRNLKVFMQKFDPYINIDASKLSPLQHGEVFLTEDGALTDLDLGHYERFIDENLTRYSSVSAGKIYQRVINKERDNYYNGKTIQVVPHITNEIKETIIEAATSSKADIVITEIGGTVGDIESLPFLEAIRQFKREIGFDNVLFIHTTLMPYVKSADEIKTKPSQHSVKELRSIGISPDILMLRSENKISLEIMQKVATFCDVKESHVFEIVDVNNLYNVIPNLVNQKIDDIILKHFKITNKNKPNIIPWINLINKIENIKDTINIAICGLYTELHDAYLSVIEALNSACYHNDVKLNIVWIDSEKEEIKDIINKLHNINGILIPGGYINKLPKNLIQIISHSRKNNIPLFGICLGFQLMIIERLLENNISATSEEFVLDKINNHVFNKVSNFLGILDNNVVDKTMQKIYANKKEIKERFRNSYIFNNEYLERIKSYNLSPSSFADKYLTSIIDHNLNFFIGVQFHPEFKSRPLKVHPLFDEFIKKAKNNK